MSNNCGKCWPCVAEQIFKSAENRLRNQGGCHATTHEINILVADQIELILTEKKCIYEP